MYTYQNGTAALKMPSNYVPLTEEEMTYVDGGYSFLNDETMKWCKYKTSTFATFIDVMAACATVSLSAGATVYAASQKVGSKLVGKIISVVTKLQGWATSSVESRYISSIVATATASLTIGGLIANAMDRGDRGGYDGYVEVYGMYK